MSFIQRRILKSVLAIVRRPRLTLAIVGITLAVCGTFALLRLTISTGQDELFSSKPVFFKDYLNFVQRFPENDALYIVLQPRDPAATPPVAQWAAAADAITAKVKGLTTLVDDAYCRVPLDQLGEQGLLFEDAKLLPTEFNDAKTQLTPLATLFGQAPDFKLRLVGSTPVERFLTGLNIQIKSLSPHDADQAAGFIKRLADSWRESVATTNAPISIGHGVPDLKRDNATDPQRLGYFYVADEQNRAHHRILIRVYKKPLFNSLDAITKQVDAIRAAALDAAKAYPQFVIGVTGRPALDSDQMRTTNDDSHKAETLALIVVFIGMAYGLGSIRLAIFAELALGAGIVWTFGWATVSVGRLNLLSVVFLIALIGIGMDYLVQILARYRVEAARRPRADAVWIRVFKHVGPPINTACLGAASAFLMSIFTDFRGAADLGIIAGGGLLLCLIAGYIVLPAILTLFPPIFKPAPAHDAGVGQTKSRWGSLILPVIWVCGLGAGATYMTRAHFDPGLITLQVPDLESVKLIRTLQTWESVVLSKDTNELEKVRSAVADLPLVASTDSILSAQDNLKWLNAHASELPTITWAAPADITATDLPTLASKARILADTLISIGTDPQTALATFTSEKTAADALRVFADSIASLRGSDVIGAASRLSSWQNLFAQELRSLLAQFTPKDLNINAVPTELRSHYISKDGYYALYIYPKQDLWNDENLKQFETNLEQAVSSVPGRPNVTGVASDLFHTTTSIHNAFFQSTFYALGFIVLLVLLDFRRLLPTLAAISVLGFGLPMLLALMGLLDVSWNFANFFGLPILIGAGHEYGVFMVHRYEEAKKFPGHYWRKWDVSDRALLLCAFITTSSFGFFWLLARHRGLKSLGLVMALGTGCIYLATLCVLRPILRWKLSRDSNGSRRDLAVAPDGQPS